MKKEPRKFPLSDFVSERKEPKRIPLTPPLEQEIFEEKIKHENIEANNQEGLRELES